MDLTFCCCFFIKLMFEECMYLKRGKIKIKIIKIIGFEHPSPLHQTLFVPHCGIAYSYVFDYFLTGTWELSIFVTICICFQ